MSVDSHKTGVVGSLVLTKLDAERAQKRAGGASLLPDESPARLNKLAHGSCITPLILTLFPKSYMACSCPSISEFPLQIRRSVTRRFGVLQRIRDFDHGVLLFG